jgi:hypothetical protein
MGGMMIGMLVGMLVVVPVLAAPAHAHGLVPG